MLIERNIRSLVVSEDATMEDALVMITVNPHRAVFCIDSAGVLVGIITDGDFRRWVLQHPGSPLSAPAREAANGNFVSLPFGTPYEEIEARFSTRIAIIPLVDERGRLVAMARPKTKAFWLEDRHVSMDAPALVIAEIGINHKGSLDIAKELIDVAAAANADCAKFQMRDMASLYRNDGVAGDYREDLGPQYTIDLLDRFSLSIDEMVEAFDYCRAVNLIPLCTPWDLKSATILDDYGIPGYKVASADLTNHDLLQALATTSRPIIMSTGMSRETEIVESVGLLQTANAPYALLQCNSTYPAPFRDVHLRYMDRLAELGDCLVGYSGHERGFHIPIAAVAMGAKIIEKHITLNRSWEGNDHKISLLPDELSVMVQQIRELEEALGVGTQRSITQGEQMNRVNLAKSLVASTAIAAGQEITADVIEIRSPGRGLQPNRRRELIGRTAKREMERGDFFFESDLSDESANPRFYKFGRSWGLPVRYHDYRALAARSNPDFLEFHMSYRDLELDVEEMVPEPLDMGLVVHSPDLFRGDHILNLADDDEVRWHRSIDELQRVVDVTRALVPKFSGPKLPLVIVSMGGFSLAAPLPSEELPRLYERVGAALDRVDSAGVEIIPQTLPPYPWYLGGQLFCNLFVTPDDTARFASDHGLRLCLDISHTKLACNRSRESFSAAIELLAPLAAHVHVVDAAGIDGEGLQIGDGEVDFDVLGEQLRRLAPHASFIPEIWQGHQNLGEGFWIALDRLERYL